jgi:alkylhydroperoxidase family enzyme
MTRVPYVTESELSCSDGSLLRSQLEKEKLAPEYRHLMSSDNRRNVYMALGQQPRVLKTFRNFIGTVGDEAGLDHYRRELLILTVARELSSRYEWHNHVRIALHKGVSVDEIHAIAENRLDVFEPADAALMQYVSAFVSGTVNDDVHDEVVDYFDTETVTGLGVFTGRYLMLARLIDALGVETEEPFVGWDLKRL